MFSKVYLPDCSFKVNVNVKLIKVSLSFLSKFVIKPVHYVKDTMMS